MANNNWNNYTEKTATPVDADEVMVRDSADGKNKKLLFGTFWKWVAKKLNEATISELQTSNKTIVGALNQLNSDKLSKSTLFVGNVYYSDDQVASIGGFEACLMDAINKNKIPTNGPFYGTFTAGMRHLMLGYRYDSGNYGVILLYKYDGSTIRWNINAGNITKT